MLCEYSGVHHEEQSQAAMIQNLHCDKPPIRNARRKRCKQYAIGFSRSKYSIQNQICHTTRKSSSDLWRKKSVEGLLRSERRWRWRRWRNLFRDTSAVFADIGAAIFRNGLAIPTTVKPIDIVVVATERILRFAER